MAPSVLMSANECPWLNGPMLMTALELSLVFNAPWCEDHECSWLLVSIHEQWWALMASLGFLWVCISGTECLCMLMITHEHSWAAMKTRHHGSMSTHESLRAVMSMAPWGHGHSSAPMSTNGHSSASMSTNGTIAPYSWVLMSANGPKWALMIAH